MSPVHGASSTSTTGSSSSKKVVADTVTTSTSTGTITWTGIVCVIPSSSKGTKWKIVTSSFSIVNLLLHMIFILLVVVLVVEDNVNNAVPMTTVAVSIPHSNHHRQQTKHLLWLLHRGGGGGGGGGNSRKHQTTRTRTTTTKTPLQPQPQPQLTTTVKRRVACGFYIYDIPSAIIIHWCQHLMKDYIYEGIGGIKFVRIQPGTILSLLYPHYTRIVSSSSSSSSNNNNNNNNKKSKDVYCNEEYDRGSNNFPSTMHLYQQHKRQHRIKPQRSSSLTTITDRCMICGGNFYDHLELWWSTRNNGLYSPYDRVLSTVLQNATRHNCNNNNVDEMDKDDQTTTTTTTTTTRTTTRTRKVTKSITTSNNKVHRQRGQKQQQSRKLQHPMKQAKHIGKENKGKQKIEDIHSFDNVDDDDYNYYYSYHDRYVQRNNVPLSSLQTVVPKPLYKEKMKNSVASSSSLSLSSSSSSSSNFVPWETRIIHIASNNNDNNNSNNNKIERSISFTSTETTNKSTSQATTTKPENAQLFSYKVPSLYGRQQQEQQQEQQQQQQQQQQKSTATTAQYHKLPETALLLFVRSIVLNSLDTLIKNEYMLQ